MAADKLAARPPRRLGYARSLPVLMLGTLVSMVLLFLVVQSRAFGSGGSGGREGFVSAGGLVATFSLAGHVQNLLRFAGVVAGDATEDLGTTAGDHHDAADQEPLLLGPDDGPDIAGAASQPPFPRRRLSPAGRQSILTPMHAPRCDNPFIADWTPEHEAAVREAYSNYLLNGFYRQYQSFVHGEYGHETIGHRRFGVAPPIFPCTHMDRVGGGGDARFRGTDDGVKLLCNLNARWPKAAAGEGEGGSPATGGAPAPRKARGSGGGSSGALAGGSSRNSSHADSSAAPCLIYSLGSNTDTSFERSIVRHTPCSTVTLDCTVSEGSVISKARGRWDPARMTFKKICLAEAESTQMRRGAPVRYTTLQTVTRELGHEVIDLLKMDIESFEYDVFSSFAKQFYESFGVVDPKAKGAAGVPAGSAAVLPLQISFELHYKGPWRENGRVLGTKRMSGSARMAHMWRQLIDMGYVAVSRDDNRLCRWCSEFTVVRAFCPENNG